MSSKSHEARNLVLQVLDAYEKSGKSIRYLLRRIIPNVSLESSMQTFVRLRALGVIQFLNTIDFICVRALRRGEFSRLPVHTKSILRLITYELRWLGTNTSDFSFLGAEFDGLNNFVAEVHAFNLDSSLKGLDQISHLSVEHSHPSFLVRTYIDNLPYEDAIELMRRSNEKRTYYFRVNRTSYGSEDCLQEITESGVSFSADPGVTGLYRVDHGETELFRLDCLRKGRVLVQDKSSVIAARTLSPRPGMKVWDACAAPGMKTHVLWEMMEEKGDLVATDIDSHRLELARRRMSKLGLEEVNFMLADAMKVPVLDADRVLIDAPCSSTGILRSHPSYKWSLNKNRLQQTMTIQNKLLFRIVEAYSGREGTEFVFATCSLLPHEGESQIDSLLRNHRIELLDIPFDGSKGYPGFRCSDKVFRLFPHRHDSNGFFISRFRVVADAPVN